MTGCGGAGGNARVQCSSWAMGPHPPDTSGAPAVVAVVRAPFIGRDGAHLIYRGVDGRLWVRRTASGEERELVLADDVSLYPGTVDAGRFVAFTTRPRDRYQEYFAVDAESCTSRELGIRVSTADVTIGYSIMEALALSGDRLFYAISRGTLQDGQQFVVDLPSLSSRAAPAEPFVVYGASMEGERVVWLQQARDGTLAVAMWNLADDTVVTHVEPVEAAPTSMASSGARAVWADHRDQTGVHKEHVYLLDLAAGEERRVAPDDTRQIDPSILDHLVAWADDGGGRFAIRLLDLDTGVTRDLVSMTGYDLRWPILTRAGLFWVAPDANGSTVYLAPTIRP